MPSGVIHRASTGAQREGASVGVIEAFGQELVSKVTGLTKRQLEYWDQLRVVQPSIAPWEPWLPRLYSFRDLMKLKVAAEMRRRKMLPSRIKSSMDELEAQGFDDPLLTLRFVGDPEDKQGLPEGPQVFYLHPETGPMSARAVGQSAEVFDLKLRDLRSGLEATIEALSRRPEGQITRVRRVQGRAPVIEGTRVPTAKIARLRDEGWGTERILAAFPHLTREDVGAALEYEDRRASRRSA